MNRFFAIIFFFAAAGLHAQNLIRDGSFEETSKINFDSDPDEDWFSANKGSPDVFFPGNSIFSMPDNYAGYQQPRTGQRYCGIIIKNSGSGTLNWREFIETKLTQSLQKGVTYTLVFYLSLSDKTSSYASSSFGAMFSTNKIAQPDNLLLRGVVTCVNPKSNFISDKENWTKMSLTFTADSAYRYVSIGNFWDADNTSCIESHGGNEERSYYYIDDVSLDGGCRPDPLGICNSPVPKPKGRMLPR